MDPHSYPVSHENDIKNSLDKLELGQLELTPNKNTILHLVSKCGDVKSVNNILKDHRSLLYHRNSEGETPTYVAAREGHTDILAIMINHFKEENDIIELFIRDMDKHTALHIAVQNHHVGVVFLLIKEIPQLVNCINAFSEIPCYLAAERGFSNILEYAFIDCNQRDFTRPDGKTALHAAAISGSAGCISVVIKLSKGLLYQEDKHGWTPLFYAIYHNDSSATAALLDADCSIGYQMLKKNDITTLPIHFATSHGHCETMKVLISKCPGCLETTYGNGKNILHFAIENKKIEVIKFFFHYEIFTRLINKRDNHGDTPIHSFMKSNLEMLEVVMDPRVDIHALNKENLTPLDVASSDEKRERLLKGIANVRSRGNQTRVLFLEVNSRPDHDEEMHQSLKEVKEKEELRMKEIEKEFEPYFKIVENLVVVVGLIATATFAAAFAVPGGFDGNEGPNQGMPVLLRKAAYKAFVVTNTVAFSCSCIVLLGCIRMLIYRLHYDEHELDEQELGERILQRQFLMYILTRVALITMAIAYVTGIYVVLTPSPALAISLCVICLFMMVSMSVFPRKVENLLEVILFNISNIKDSIMDKMLIVWKCI